MSFFVPISRRDRGFIEPNQSIPRSTTPSGLSTTTATIPDTVKLYPNWTIRDQTLVDYEGSNSTTLNTEPGHLGLLASGEAIFTYLVPALLHLNGYLLAVFIYRFADNEQLQSLVERVRM
uniref:Uncharacterized protein n=1 Tax=Anopheles maculatus TaxID=74869 RepID=A0A182SRI5_9DIPT